MPSTWKILYLARKAELAAREVGVIWRHHSDSKIHLLRDGVGLLHGLISIRWNDLLGRYEVGERNKNLRSTTGGKRLMTRLGVNVDHVATVRQARRAPEPDPVTAALLAELAGADGITVHLRGDRRHIGERDVRLLREAVTTAAQPGNGRHRRDVGNRGQAPPRHRHIGARNR